MEEPENFVSRWYFVRWHYRLRGRSGCGVCVLEHERTTDGRMDGYVDYTHRWIKTSTYGTDEAAKWRNVLALHNRVPTLVCVKRVESVECAGQCACRLTERNDVHSQTGTDVHIWYYMIMTNCSASSQIPRSQPSSKYPHIQICTLSYQIT